jgi:hypothetical protein
MVIVVQSGLGIEVLAREPEGGLTCVKDLYTSPNFNFTYNSLSSYKVNIFQAIARITMHGKSKIE